MKIFMQLCIAGRIRSGTLVGLPAESRSVSRRNAGRIHLEFTKAQQSKNP
jgi:hypothetical protein